MNFRNYLAGTILVMLLIWGPIDHSWPAWLAIRIGYLILVPLAIWFLLGWIWNYFQPSSELEVTLERILSGVIFIGLVILGILEATSKTHIGNTQWVRTRDGMEAVGDDIVVDGPSWGNVFIIGIIAVLILWFGVLRKGVKSSDT